MSAFCFRAVGCFLSVAMCFGGGCAAESVESGVEQESDGQLQGTISVIAQVQRSNVRTFLPATLGPSADGKPQYGLVPQAYVRQGAAFAVSAISVIAPNASTKCDVVAAPENACTHEGWVHVVPMFESRAQAVTSSYVGGFWLRAEDVVLVQVSGPMLASDESGRVLNVKQARDVIVGITRLSASRGTPLGTSARPSDAVVYSAPGADGLLREQERNSFGDMTVGASLDANDSSVGWVVRGADAYLLQTSTELCGNLLSGPRCDGWVGLEGLGDVPLVAGVSGWVVFWGVVVLIGIALAIVVIRWQNSKRTTTGTVAEATGVPPVLDPAATITPTQTVAPVALPTTAPPPPPPGSVPEMRCWPAEDKMCRYTKYHNDWYCLCLRHSALTYNDAGQECGPLNFWRGSWEDGCAIPERDISQMGNACWFPDECPGGKRFNNDL